MPRLTYRLHPDGRVEVQVRDVPGPDCHALIAEAEALLGPALTRAPTPEYYQTTTETPQHLRQESGS